MAEYTIYIVGRGSYSDAHDICGFVTEELAQKYVDALVAVEYPRLVNEAKEILRSQSKARGREPLQNPNQVEWANSFFLKYPTVKEYVKNINLNYWIVPLVIWDMVPVVEERSYTART
jgi:hypothetical protein